MASGGVYEELLPHTQKVDVFGVLVRCVTLERLIQLKHATGGPKDLGIAEPIPLLEERRGMEADKG